MAMPREDRESWNTFLADVGELIPIAREHGFSPDTLLIAVALNKLSNRLSDLYDHLVEHDE
jgi:hypothetical protein